MDAEKALDAIFDNNYRIRLDHFILDDHGVFYPQALFNDLVFEQTLASASQVVKGSDASKLVYKLINIKLECGNIRSNTLEKEATAYTRRQGVLIRSYHARSGDITKVGVTVNGSPNKVYNNGIEAKNLWQEISQYVQPNKVSSKMDLPWFYTDNKFRLFIDLRSMADTTKQESGVLYC